jgi:hypothetical protein
MATKQITYDEFELNRWLKDKKNVPDIKSRLNPDWPLEFFSDLILICQIIDGNVIKIGFERRT